MKVLAYILATLLLLWSLYFAGSHFRPVPRYIGRIFHDPFEITAWRGLIFGAGITSASIYVCIRTYQNPSSYWLLATLAFILINILATSLMLYWGSKAVKRYYEIQED